MLNFKSKFFSVLLSFILMLTLLLFGCLFTLNPDILTGSSSPGINNEYCKIIKEKGDNATYIERSTCKNNFKKSKFIWILLDGLAFDQLSHLTNRVKYNIPNFFKITTNHFRQSGALHETYLTGKFSRNFPANEVKIDHVIKQAANSDYNIFYRGHNFPVFSLFGGEETKVLKNHVVKRNEYYPFQNMCKNIRFMDSKRLKYPKNFIDDNGDLLISREEFSKYLEENLKWDLSEDHITKCLINAEIYKNKDKPSNSFVFYTMIIDHFNHSYSKYNYHTLGEIYSIEIILLHFIEWIQKNEEYALIITSDHGGQPYNGEDNICNHGCMVKGNEAIMTIYTKELANAPNQIKLLDDVDADIEDVAPTIAQILEDVNIPLESTGFPLYLNKDRLVNLVALKSKEVQLIAKIKAYFEKKGNNKSLALILREIENSDFFAKLNSLENRQDIDEILNFDKFLSDYKTFLKNKQSEINKEIKSTGQSLTSTILILIFFSFLVFNIISSFILLIKSITHKKFEISNHKKTITICCILVILFLDIIFSMISENLVKAYNNIHLISFLIILIAFYIIKHISYSKINHKIKKELNTDIKVFLYGLFIITIIVISFAEFDLFLKIKFIFSNFKIAKKLDILNYIIFISFLIWSTRKLSYYYLFSCMRLRLDIFLYFFYSLLVSLMIIFDYNLPKHFSNQTSGMQRLVRSIYSFMIFYLIFTFKRFYRKEGKEPVILFQIFKYPFIIYIYFVSDEAERIFMLLFILPLLTFFSYFINKFSDDILRILSYICLIIVPDIIYTLTKGSLSFDVSLKVCYKSIGNFPDETPLITGFLMGTHKISVFILTACFIIEHIEYGKNFFKSSFYHLKILSEMQWNFLIINYIFYIYKDYEEYYLNLFIWTGTKCICLLLVDIVSLSHYTFNHDGGYKKIKSEDDIRMHDIEKLT